VNASGDLVESILQLTGWTQVQLVYELRVVARALQEPEPSGLQPVTVNRWMRGRQKPGGYYERLLRLLYAAVRGQLAAGRSIERRVVMSASVGNEDGDEMKRRRFLTCTAALAAGFAVDPEALTAALLSSSAVDATVVDGLGLSVREHVRRWHLERPDALLPIIKKDVTTLNELRIGSSVAGARRRLASLTAETAAVAGWLAWQSGNDEAAEAYYTFAHSLTSESRDHDGRAFVLVLRSFVRSGLFRPGAADDRAVLAMLHEAVELTARSTSPFVRVFALARRAEELARTGDVTAVERDLDRADTVLAAARAPDDGFFSYFDEDRLLGCRGTCAAAQRRPREAASLLSAMLAATPAELAAERSILLADLGGAYAMLGEVDHACDLLVRSLELGGDGYANRVGRVLAIRAAHLTRWSSSPGVVRLDESLHATRATLTDPIGAPTQR
jgi:hypothetical protein